MTTQLHPRSRQQAITVQRVGHEVLLYDERTHQAFCLNPAPAAVWELADGHRSLDEISREASLKLKTPVPPAVVEFALSTLAEQGLLEPVPVAAPLPPPVSRRAMLHSLGSTSLLLLPAVAAIAAPPAAQAYNGCFDCSSGSPAAQRRAAARQAAAAASQRKLQQLTRTPANPE